MKGNRLLVVGFLIGKYKYLTTTNIGRGLLYQGMNEKGISVTNNAGPLKLNNALKLGKTDIQRDVLETCSSLQEADALLKNYTVNIGVIFNVGSAFEEDGSIC